MNVLYFCEKCLKPVYEKYGSGRFCSRSCANSRIRTEAIKQKISKSVKANYEYVEFNGKLITVN